MTNGELNQAHPKYCHLFWYLKPCSKWCHLTPWFNLPSPPFFCFPLLLPPTQLWSIHSYPFPLFPFPNPPLPCTPSLPALPPLTVWTRCRKLWPFFHTPPASADPSRWGSDSESGPRRVPGILLYQPRVHRKCCCHHCHRAGLITAHAWTHGHTRKHTQLFLQDQSLPNPEIHARMRKRAL